MIGMHDLSLSLLQRLITCDVHLGGALVAFDDLHHPFLDLFIQIICYPALVKPNVHLGPPEAPSPPWRVNYLPCLLNVGSTNQLPIWCTQSLAVAFITAPTFCAT